MRARVFTLSGLYINDSTATEQGLFAYVRSAYIQNLVISNPSVTVANNSGIVFAKVISYAKFTNVTITGAVLNGKNCGGFGYFADSIEPFTNCRFEGTIFGGNNGGFLQNGLGTTMKDCTFDGLMQGSGNGGFVYLLTNNGSFENCTTTENAQISDVANGFSGGIIAKFEVSSYVDMYGTDNLVVKDCVNNAKVMGKSYGGGIIGLAKDTSDISCTMLLSNCTNNGFIDGAGNSGILGNTNIPTTIKNCTNNGDVRTSSGYSAGIVGYVEDRVLIEDCTNYGDINFTGKFSSELAGILAIVNTTEDVTVRRCFNHGDLNDSGYSGGIAGRFNAPHGVVEDCANTGNVNCLKNYGGGLIGYIYLSAPGRITVRNCYSVAESVKAKSYVGGLFGYLERTTSGALEDGDAIYVNNCYGVAKAIEGDVASTVVGRATGGSEMYFYHVYAQALSGMNAFGENGGVLGEPKEKAPRK